MLGLARSRLLRVAAINLPILHDLYEDLQARKSREIDCRTSASARKNEDQITRGTGYGAH
jgi:hypothetical protein